MEKLVNEIYEKTPLVGSWGIHNSKKWPTDGYLIPLKTEEMTSFCKEEIEEYIKKYYEFFIDGFFLFFNVMLDRDTFNLVKYESDLYTALSTGILIGSDTIFDLEDNMSIDLPLPQKAGTYTQQKTYAATKAQELFEELTYDTNYNAAENAAQTINQDNNNGSTELSKQVVLDIGRYGN